MLNYQAPTTVEHNDLLSIQGFCKKLMNNCFGFVFLNVFDSKTCIHHGVPRSSERLKTIRKLYVTVVSLKEKRLKCKLEQHVREVLVNDEFK
jgi:hypothetical protein